MSAHFNGQRGAVARGTLFLNVPRPRKRKTQLRAVRELASLNLPSMAEW